MTRVLVTGATGTIGREVVAQLAGTDARVRAMSRTPENATVPPGVELVRGDLTAAATLDAALDDVDVVFLVWTAGVDAVPAAIERIARHVNRVVYLTAPHQTPHPFFQQPNPLARLHAMVEQTIDASGLAWTFLRPGMFAANALGWWAPQLRRGEDVVRWPCGDAPTAPIDERDVAAVAVRALLDGAHAGQSYVLTGPESLTQREQLAIIGDAIGRKLRFEELSPEEAVRELPFPPAATQMLLNAWTAALGLPAYMTSRVAEITGRPARSFREWAVDHAGEFRA